MWKRLYSHLGAGLTHAWSRPGSGPSSWLESSGCRLMTFRLFPFPCVALTLRPPWSVRCPYSWSLPAHKRGCGCRTMPSLPSGQQHPWNWPWPRSNFNVSRFLWGQGGRAVSLEGVQMPAMERQGCWEAFTCGNLNHRPLVGPVFPMTLSCRLSRLDSWDVGARPCGPLYLLDPPADQGVLTAGQRAAAPPARTPDLPPFSPACVQLGLNHKGSTSSSNLSLVQLDLWWEEFPEMLGARWGALLSVRETAGVTAGPAGHYRYPPGPAHKVGPAYVCVPPKCQVQLCGHCEVGGGQGYVD